MTSHPQTAAPVHVGEPLPTLNRNLTFPEKPPVRIVHLGLGAFHRSHQAWYTHRAGDSRDWGIAAFTGRRPNAALALSAQDGLYTVVERAEAADSFEVVGSIVEAVDGADVERLAELVASEAVAVITLTITEAAYRLDADGNLDRTAQDVEEELALLASGAGSGKSPKSPLGRLVVALERRRTVGAGPLALVCCDNLSNNGTVAHNAVTGLAHAWDPELAAWIEANVSFVSTSVDRITPRTTDDDIAVVEEACGYSDNSPVVTEPFHNWALSGSFPAGRPQWGDAGAIFVDDIEQYENRKLWLLNGAHSMLAYAGQLRGHTTVAEALSDELCLRAVESFWGEASVHLHGDELRLPEYRAALLERFGNSRIAHHLAQIAMDGSTKLRMRAVPVLRAERRAGRAGSAAALMIAAWLDFAATGEISDPLANEVAAANTLSGAGRIRSLLHLLDPGLAADADLVSLISRLSGSFKVPTV